MARERLTQAERRARTRDALLDAATSLVSERGFVATSVDAIAEKAGYTSGAIYDHFGNKEGVLIALVERGIATDPLHWDDAINPDDALPDQLRSLGRAAARNVAKSSTDSALIYEVYAYAIRSPELRARIGDLIGEQLQAIGAALPLSGALSGTDVVVLGQALLDGLRLRAMFNPGLVRKELFEEGLALLANIEELQRIDERKHEATSPRRKTRRAVRG